MWHAQGLIQVLMRCIFLSSAQPPLRAVGLLLVLTVITACGPSGASTPSPTPRPTPRATPIASPTPEPTLPPGAVVLEVTNRMYSTATLIGTAGVPTIVVFTNHDALNHNLTIYRNASQDLELFRGDIFTGPEVTVTYEIPALPAGDYYFADYVYPSMHGIFIVR